jgi:chemotaxis protein MotB
MKRIVLVGLLAATGCVSTGKFNTLQSQYDAEAKKAAALQEQLGQADVNNADLSKTKGELEGEKAALIQDKATLQQQTADLGAQKAGLEADMARLTAERNTLSGEKQALLAANQEKERQYDGIVGQLQQEVSDGNLKITKYKNMLTVDVADKILFDSGKAEIKADGMKILKKVGDALAKSDKTIRVVGHTDNVPLIAGAAYASNWELSAVRATTVVRFLQEQAKIDPLRLIAEGRSEYAPVAPNDSPANRQKNRRIEITLLDKSLVEAVMLKGAEAPAGLSATASAPAAAATAAPAAPAAAAASPSAPAQAPSSGAKP